MHQCTHDINNVFLKAAYFEQFLWFPYNQNVFLYAVLVGETFTLMFIFCHNSSAKEDAHINFVQKCQNFY